MNRSALLSLFLLGVLVYAGVAAFQPAPGYMDADYYTVNGLRIANGDVGEPFLWHYLDDPQGIPHPAFSYWMPLPAWIAALGALGARLTPFQGAAAARWPFLLMSAAVPPLTAALGYALTRRRADALLAGALALFSGFYLPFLPAADAFAPLMLVGGLFFLLLVAPARSSGAAFSLGVLAGLVYLSRAEGLLWLLIAAFVLGRARAARRLPWLLAGFLLPALPWMLRNLAVFGTPLSPVGGRPLWLTAYDELYRYPADALTPGHLLASGWSAIARARLWALGQNLQTALAVQGGIFLAPLMVWGAWRLRRRLAVQTGALAWALLLLVMSLLFPFAGARGGFFHAGAALQPLAWALAPAGLDAFVRWGEARRGWQRGQARRVFGGGALALAALLSGLLFVQRVPGVWGGSEAHYQRVETWLQAQGAPASAVVMVNNPPGYHLVSGRPAIAVPYGGLESLLAAARRYGARYLILEPNYRGGPLETLYRRPPSALRLLGQVDETLIFLIAP